MGRRRLGDMDNLTLSGCGPLQLQKGIGGGAGRGSLL